MADVDVVMERFFAVCNETDGARRRALVGETFTESATFVDPLFQAEGAEALDGLLGQILAIFPEHETRQKGAADAHHEHVRFSWEIVPTGGGAPVAAGTDFGLIAPDGRLQSIVSFFDMAPVLPG